MTQQAKPVRVRFAPSPTGHLHIGSLRTALFNWLFARHNKGVFLVRIEDTDPERSRPEYTESIMNALAWSGLTSDEQVVFQSQRLAIYSQAIEQLLKKGKAYRCYCSPELLQQKRDNAGNLHYDRTCWGKKEQPGVPSAIRFYFDDPQALTFTDIIRGTVTFEADQFDDFVIARSDGSPMYNFCVVIDDVAMNISHVIRGEDHIPNTPKQIALYRALGYDIPKFAHIPLILGPSGNRLSKRDAAVSVLDYRANGYLPDALCNYLVRLGWAHGDQEIFTTDELIKYFALEDVGKKCAIFDQGKLDWVNGTYIRQKQPTELLQAVQAFVDPDFSPACSSWSSDQLLHMIALYQGRVSTLREMATVVRATHQAPEQYDSQAIAQWIKENTPNYLEKFAQDLQKQDPFDAQMIASYAKRLCKEWKISLGELAQPIRIALIGQAAGPGVFELVQVLGKKESGARLNRFIAFLAR